MSRKLEIVNIISSFSFGENLAINMRKLRDQLTDYKYDRKFNRFFFGFRKPYGSITMYKTGNGISMGVKSLEETRAIIRRLGRRLQKVGYKIRYDGYEVSCIATTINVGHEIDLYALAEASGSFCRFNPETFAGAIYHQDNLKITFFRNGKVNATGLRSTAEIGECEAYILRLAEMFKLKTQ